MNIKVAQECPQCGAAATLNESDRLLTCSYCGVKIFLQPTGIFRYLLPPTIEEEESAYLLVPYIRFKGTIFLVTDKGLSHKVVDTTQLAVHVPGLPPSLGIRAQAMQLQHLNPATSDHFLVRTLEPNVILHKAAQISHLTAKAGKNLFHRAYIGETLSVIYLPLIHTDQGLLDAVNRYPLAAETRTRLSSKALKSSRYHPQWQPSFLPSLCPHCGSEVEGASDSLVVHCFVCDRCWRMDEKDMKEVPYQVVDGDQRAALYIPFWKLQALVTELNISSFADFIACTNQPILPQPDWEKKPMQFLVPAFKVRPKVFIQAGRQATLGQWKLPQGKGQKRDPFFPVTLSSSEGKQAVKIILAASATSPKAIFPHLPKVKAVVKGVGLVYLPFNDQGHDWVQAHTGVTIGKNILRFGRQM